MLDAAVFIGGREQLSDFLRTISGNFYVYCLCRANGQPFYIGKGIHRRVLDHEQEAMQAHPIGESNPFKCNVIRKLNRTGESVTYRIDSVFEPTDEQSCLEREAALIVEHGRLHEGGPLTNLAGGIGSRSGAAPHSKKKHAATLSGMPENNPERMKLNMYLQGIGPVKSVPVKPLSQISRVLPTKPHTQPRKPTARCAYALVASACAHGLMIQPDVEIPRMFEFDGVEGVIENGVARDILKAGMATLVPATDAKYEKFLLNQRQCKTLTELSGAQQLAERGII